LDPASLPGFSGNGDTERLGLRPVWVVDDFAGSVR
jgi:hypothetical protein